MWVKRIPPSLEGSLLADRRSNNFEASFPDTSIFVKAVKSAIPTFSRTFRHSCPTISKAFERLNECSSGIPKYWGLSHPKISIH